MKETAMSGARGALQRENAKRYPPLLKLLGPDWGISSSQEFDGTFIARNEVTGQEIRRTTFDKFELAVQCAAAERDKARKPLRSQPRRRTQSPLAAVRPSPPRPRTFRPMMTVEYEAELERLKDDLRMEALAAAQLDVHRDGLRRKRDRLRSWGNPYARP